MLMFFSIDLNISKIKCVLESRFHIWGLTYIFPYWIGFMKSFHLEQPENWQEGLQDLLGVHLWYLCRYLLPHLTCVHAPSSHNLERAIWICSAPLILSQWSTHARPFMRVCKPSIWTKQASHLSLAIGMNSCLFLAMTGAAKKIALSETHTATLTVLSLQL